jgi:hypothetical protein
VSAPPGLPIEEEDEKMRPGSDLLSCGGLLQANDIIAFIRKP